VYLKSITNAQGLLNVDSADALDWHPQEKRLTPGVVAEYNVLYYHALRSAARLADALGKANEELAREQTVLTGCAVRGPVFEEDEPRVKNFRIHEFEARRRIAVMRVDHRQTRSSYPLAAVSAAAKGFG
jgi:hypothetical protein